MKIKMLTQASGPDFQAKPGQIVEVDKKQGQALIAGGYAVKTGGDAPAPAKKRPRRKETGKVNPPENTALDPTGGDEG